MWRPSRARTSKEGASYGRVGSGSRKNRSKRINSRRDRNRRAIKKGVPV